LCSRINGDHIVLYAYTWEAILEVGVKRE
jgi:hypothetical protein